MSLKDKIKKIIDVISDSDINEIEISSFWGAQKIKLTKKISPKKNNTINAVAPVNTNVVPINTIETISTKEKEEDNTDIIDNNNDINETNKDINITKKEQPESSIKEEDLCLQKAPLVGTFYISPKPGEPPFIKTGETVHKGQTLCIIEAMKIYNEIESDFDGVVHEILVDDSSPVEFNQSIISILPE